jgi:hypothetical protein
MNKGRLMLGHQIMAHTDKGMLGFLHRRLTLVTPPPAAEQLAGTH